MSCLIFVPSAPLESMICARELQANCTERALRKTLDVECEARPAIKVVANRRWASVAMGQPQLSVPVGNQIRAYRWCRPPRIGVERTAP